LYVDGPWLSITTGTAYACALNGDTGVYCWGYNGSGQLGVGDNQARNAPTGVQ
jgi:alpha-tubulin suppressor-like RCC1 family protein